MRATRPSQLFRNKSAKIAAIPMIVTAPFVFVGGTAWTIVYSFTKSGLLPRLKWVGLDQYERLWSTNRWLVSIENLIIYGLCMLVLVFVIGFILAALIDQKIVPCINVRPYVFHDLMMTLPDFVKNFCHELSIERGRHMLQDILKVILYKGNR